MAHKLSPRRTGRQKKQVVRMEYTRVFKAPKKSKGSKELKTWMVIHHRREK